jgi:tetratricopeptide (TPR) repeat protein
MYTTAKFAGMLYLVPVFAFLAGSNPVSQAADGSDAAAVGAIAKAWTALYRNEPGAAAASVGRLVASRQPSVRLTALHIKARSLWLTGDPASRQSAQQIWAQLASEAKADKESLARIGVAKCLDLAARGQDREAVAALEAVAKEAMYSSAALEIAIELAILQGKAGNADAAKASLAAATKELEKAESYGIPKPIADAFAGAIWSTRESLGSPARALLLRALGMQREKQYQKAITLFGEVSKDFPGTDEDHRSQFEVGSCYGSFGQAPKAIEHWQKFTASAPAAPWRGQAFVRLIESALMERLDLNEAVTYAEQANLAMPKALADAAAGTSWEEVEYPLALRIAIVALCRDRQAEAIAALDAARSHAKNPVLAEKVDRLAAAAKNASGLIPEDCRDGRSLAPPSSVESAPLALSLGMAFQVAGEPTLAVAFFDRVLGKPATRGAQGKPGQPAVRGIAGATSAQLAFASFGKGAILEAGKKPDQAHAIKAFSTALDLHRDAPWHDETLYRAAMTAATPEEAVPFWLQLLEKFPTSPRREFASYRYASTLWDQAESMAKKAAGGAATAADTAKVDQAWENAAAALAKVTESYPAGPYSGEVLVKQIDIGLERTFDLEGADSACKRAIAWFERSPPPPNSLSLAAATALPVWAAPQAPPPEVARDALAFRTYVAAGLVALLQKRTDEAVAMFGKASGFDKSRRQEIGAETSMKRMISVAQGSGPDFSPHDMLKGLKNEKQRTGVLLADLALLTFDPERAGSLYERILAGEPPFGSPSAELEAYLILRMGQALEFQKKHDDAVTMLTRLYDPKFSKYSWASDGIFRLGTWNHNATQKTASAMPHWEHVFTKTPSHPEAERALFYYGINAKRDGDHALAERAFRMYLERYPASRWTNRIRDYELPAVLKSMETAKK